MAFDAVSFRSLRADINVPFLLSKGYIAAATHDDNSVGTCCRSYCCSYRVDSYFHKHDALLFLQLSSCVPKYAAWILMRFIVADVRTK